MDGTSLPLLLSLMLLLPGGASAAQTSAGATATEQQSRSSEPPSPVAMGSQTAAETIRAELEKLGAELKQLRQELADAKGGQKEVLRTQVRDKEKAAQSKLDDLLANLKEREQAREDVGDQRAMAASWTRRVSAYLRENVEAGVSRLKELAEQTPADDAAKAEQDKAIAAEHQGLNQYLADLLANTTRAKVLGLNASGDLAYLDELLVRRAETLAGTIELVGTQKDAAAKALGSGATEEEKTASRKALATFDNKVRVIAASLEATVKLMDQRGLENTAFKQRLIQSTGQISEDIFEADVALGLIQGWLDQGREWLMTAGPGWVFKIVLVLLILWIFRRLSKIARRLVHRGLVASKAPVSQLLQQSFQAAAGGAVMMVGILIALSQLGIDLAPLLAGLGIAGFIVGFALQDTLGNFASGVMILFYRPFDVGDAVEAGGVTGTVRQMNLVSTTILTWDNQKLVVPNKKIWGEVIRNITAEATRRVDLEFGIGYSDDVEKAERVLNEIVDAHPLVLREPAPIIRLHALGESSIDFVVRPWARTSDYWTVYWDITRQVKKRFDAEGISIPFPRRDVHIYQERSANG